MKKLLFSLAILLFAGGLYAQSAQNGGDVVARKQTEMIVKKHKLDSESAYKVLAAQQKYYAEMNKISSMKETNTKSFEAQSNSLAAERDKTVKAIVDASPSKVAEMKPERPVNQTNKATKEEIRKKYELNGMTPPADQQ